jgi:hypothetical protein
MPSDNGHDPRARLVREKYFSLRPKPLEHWLWAQGVPASAERVFWLHWQEGLQRGDWCSEVPLKRVARECCLDLSTVTRAYQLLARMGCIRRTDPGRDPANPFNQATAVTEVRVPRELLVELDRYPNRHPGTAGKNGESAPVRAAEPVAAVAVAETSKSRDPFAGLRGRDRRQALNQLLHAMSAAEQSRYHEALRTRQGHLSFDADSKLSAEDRGRVLQLLSILAVEPAKVAPERPGHPTSAARGPRTLSVFELARLKRDIQAATTSAAAPELMRQVVWSIEEGSLKRFTPVHAIHIALKKLREGAWTRPNRMPPNWARAMGAPAVLETCRRA